MPARKPSRFVTATTAVTEIVSQQVSYPKPQTQLNLVFQPSPILPSQQLMPAKKP